MARGFLAASGGSQRVKWSGTVDPVEPFTLAAKGYSTGVSSDGAALWCVTDPSYGWASIGYDTSEEAGGRWQYQAFDGSSSAAMIDDTDWVHDKWFSLVARSYVGGNHEFDVRRLDTGRTANDTGSSSLSLSTGFVFVQGNNDDPTYNRGWEGYWAETAYWSVALTDAEVLAYQLGVSPWLIRPASLGFYDRSISGLRPDEIGGRTGTVTGSLTEIAHPPGILYPGQPTTGWIPGAAAAAGSLHLTPVMRRHYMSILEQ